MNEKFSAQIDGLLEKYTELLVGESTPELKEKVHAWALYSFIAKSMPPLAKHWNDTYPEAKEEMKSLIGEIKNLNEEQRSKKKN